MNYSVEGAARGQVGGVVQGSAILRKAPQGHQPMLAFFEEIQACSKSPSPDESLGLATRVTQFIGEVPGAEAAIGLLFQYLYPEEEAPQFQQVQEGVQTYLDQEAQAVLNSASEEVLSAIMKELEVRIEEGTREIQELEKMCVGQAQQSLADEAVDQIRIRIQSCRERLRRNERDLQAAQGVFLRNRKDIGALTTAPETPISSSKADSRGVEEWESLLSEVCEGWKAVSSNWQQDGEINRQDADALQVKLSVLLGKIQDLKQTRHLTDDRALPPARVERCLLNIQGALAPNASNFDSNLEREVSQFLTWLTENLLSPQILGRGGLSPQPPLESNAWVQDVNVLCGAIEKMVTKAQGWGGLYSLASRLTDLQSLGPQVQKIAADQGALTQRVQEFLELVQEILKPIQEVSLQQLRDFGLSTEQLEGMLSEFSPHVEESLGRLSVHVQSIRARLPEEGAEATSKPIMIQASSQVLVEQSTRPPYTETSQEGRVRRSGHQSLAVASVMSAYDWKQVFDPNKYFVAERQPKIRALLRHLLCCSPEERQAKLGFLEEAMTEGPSAIDCSANFWKEVLCDLRAPILRDLFDGDPCPTLKQIVCPADEQDPSFGALTNAARAALQDLGLVHDNIASSAIRKAAQPQFWGIIETEVLACILGAQLCVLYNDSWQYEVRRKIQHFSPQEKASARQFLLAQGLDCLISLIFPQCGQNETQVEQIYAPPMEDISAPPPMSGYPIQDLLTAIECLPSASPTEEGGSSGIYHSALIALAHSPKEAVQEMGLANSLLEAALKHYRANLSKEEVPRHARLRMRVTVVAALLRHCQLQEDPREALTSLLQEDSSLRDKALYGALKDILDSRMREDDAVIKLWAELASVMKISTWKDLHGFFLDDCCLTLLELSRPHKIWHRYLYSWALIRNQPVMKMLYALEERCKQNERLAERMKDALALPLDVTRMNTDVASVIHAALPSVFECRTFARQSLFILGWEAFLAHKTELWEMLLPWGMLYALAHRERDQNGTLEQWKPGYGSDGTIRRNLGQLCTAFSDVRENWNKLRCGIVFVEKVVPAADHDLWYPETTEEGLFNEIARRVIRKGLDLSSSEAEVEEPQIFSEEWFLRRQVTGLTRWVVRKGLNIISRLGKDPRALADDPSALTDQFALSGALWWPILELCRGDRENQEIVLEALESSLLIQRAFIHALTHIDPDGGAEDDIQAIQENHPWLPKRLFGLRIRSQKGLLDEVVALQDCCIERVAEDLMRTVKNRAFLLIAPRAGERKQSHLNLAQRKR